MLAHEEFAAQAISSIFEIFGEKFASKSARKGEFL